MKKTILTIMLAFAASATFAQQPKPKSDSVKISRQDYEMFKAMIGPAYERIQEQQKSTLEELGKLYQRHFKPDTAKKK